jgi:hypothetical protein
MNGDRQECLAYRAAKLARVNSVKQDGRGQPFSQFGNLSGSVGPRAPSGAVHFHIRTGSSIDRPDAFNNAESVNPTRDPNAFSVIVAHQKLNLWPVTTLAVLMG